MQSTMKKLDTILGQNEYNCEKSENRNLFFSLSGLIYKDERNAIARAQGKIPG